MDKNKISLVTKEEIEKREGKQILERELPTNVDPKILPDVHELSSQIIKILNRTLDEDILKIQKSQPIMYEKILEQEFPDFCENNYGLFRMIIHGDSPDILCHFLTNLDRVKRGELTFKEASHEFGESLDEKYFYPNFSKSQVKEIKKKKKEELEKEKK
jgi:hypothetical protein